MDETWQHIIEQGEDESTEFKTSFNDEVITSLVAFANTKGGVVYVGIKDNGTVKGIELGKETIQNWVNEIKNKTAPLLIPDVEIINLNEKTIVSFKIQEYPVKLVSIKGKYYKRVKNANHQLLIILKRIIYQFLSLKQWAKDF